MGTRSATESAAAARVAREWMIRAAVLLGWGSLCLGADVPSPESRLGFRPGADGHLVGWSTVVDYVRAVDQGSDRVVVEELGKSTEGRPFLAVVVSNEATVRDLDRFRGLQARLSDPRRFSNPAEVDRALAESKPVVVVTCSIHSTETASTLMALELLHELATGNDPATREVLDNTILVLIPSVNPDGVDKVATWYERTRGTPWEGSGMVELYHKYAGHDTNRDWFMLNLVETRLVSKLLYREWFPTVLYDVHQMGSKGARLFVPPFYDPINPNLDPRVHQGIFLIGAHMAADLAAAGKRGVLTNAMYDNWWNGGNRTTPQRHNIVAVLTEAASVKMATPIFLEQEDLKGGSRGFADHKPAVNFVDPWPGGWWRLRDIVEYERICARSLLTLTARYRRQFQSNLVGMARDSIERGKAGPPYGWVIPRDQPELGTATRMLRILHDTGIEIHEARTPFKAAGASYPAGTWVIPAAQPYRSHAKDMMERQTYPDRFTAGGKAEPPYDVAGWTLPLQMGVKVVQVDEPFQVSAERLSSIRPVPGRIVGNIEASPLFRFSNRSNDDLRLLNALNAVGVTVESPATEGGQQDPWPTAGNFLIFQNTPETRKVLVPLLDSLNVTVEATAGPSSTEASRRMKKVSTGRLALYQPWVPNMDEGWTRLVLEDLRIPYTTVHDADIRAGSLRARFDVLLIPSIPPRTIREGHAPNETEPAYTGGLGATGVAALQEFLRAGGRVVCLDASCDFAISAFDLPVKNVLKGLSSSTYYAPGSILEAVAHPRPGMMSGVPERISVYVDNSPAFELSGPGHVALRFAPSQPLQSGWLLGPERIQGKGALVIVPSGTGQVVLFGFRPQHRGQPHGTFRLLHNALLISRD
ncbi:MAG: M14 metallopeptidase family protein [Isosphaeraceae bacterium]